MKKHLLMLLSWTMLALGAISFASCGDDDDDDKSGNGSSQKTSIVEKYKGQSGASIDGDNVVYVTSEALGKEIVVYHFSGNKIDKATVYIDFGSEAGAKAAYDEIKNVYPDAQIDGSVISYSQSNEEIEEYDGLTKEQVCQFLNTLNSMRG